MDQPGQLRLSAVDDHDVEAKLEVRQAGSRIAG